MNTNHQAVTMKITAAFRELRREGYFCRQRWTCCVSCGIAAAQKEGATDQIVFYHEQSFDALKETGRCWLVWRGDGVLIVAVLEKHGLDCEWDGSDQTRIMARLA